MSGTARDDDRNAKLMALLGLSAKYDHNGEGESVGYAPTDKTTPTKSIKLRGRLSFWSLKRPITPAITRHIPTVMTSKLF
jgi:hypothetical protein